MTSKKVYENSWLSIYVPETLTGWCSLALGVITAIHIAGGHQELAFRSFEMGMLLAILDEVKNGKRLNREG